MTAMTEPERPEHLDGLRRLKGFPTNEDSAVSVVVRYYADRGIGCTREEALGKANWCTKKGGLSAKGLPTLIGRCA
jgi:hypothetical protein